MNKYKGMRPRYHTHRNERTVLAVQDHAEGIYDVRQTQWRIGEQAEYMRVWKKLEDGYEIVFTELE